MARQSGRLSLQTLIAGVVTIIALVLAIGFLLTLNGGGEVRSTTAESDAPPVFPDLGDQRDAIARIVIQGPESDDPTVTLNRSGDAWTVAQMSDYPAVEGRVPEFLDVLTGARKLAEADPDKVQDTIAETGGWRRVRLLDDGGATLLSVRIGPQVSSPKARDLTATYIGRGDADTVWLADLELAQSIAAPSAWVDQQILALGRERIAAVRTAPRDGEPMEIRRVAGSTGGFEVVGLDRELLADTEWKIGDLTVPFTDLTFEQVRPATSENGAWPGFVKTTNGIVVRFDVTKEDGAYWARFKIDTDDKAPAESGEGESEPTAEVLDVEALRARVQDRAFRVPEYTANRMLRPRESLETERGADGAAAGDGASAADGQATGDGASSAEAMEDTGQSEP